MQDDSPAEPNPIPSDPNNRPDNPLNRAVIWVENGRLSISEESVESIAQRQEHEVPLPPGIAQSLSDLGVLSDTFSSRDLEDHVAYYASRVMASLRIYEKKGIHVAPLQALGSSWLDGLIAGIALGQERRADPEWGREAEGKPVHTFREVVEHAKKVRDVW